MTHVNRTDELGSIWIYNAVNVTITILGFVFLSLARTHQTHELLRDTIVITSYYEIRTALSLFDEYEKLPNKGLDVLKEFLWIKLQLSHEHQLKFEQLIKMTLMKECDKHLGYGVIMSKMDIVTMLSEVIGLGGSTPGTIRYRVYTQEQEEREMHKEWGVQCNTDNDQLFSLPVISFLFLASPDIFVLGPDPFFPATFLYRRNNIDGHGSLSVETQKLKFAFTNFVESFY
ncbi:hypothetical protein ACJX0J_038310 [Zea mays]